MEEEKTTRLIFVTYIPEWDVDTAAWGMYRYLTGKARFMVRDVSDEGWSIRRGKKKQELYIDDSECIDITPYLTPDQKITQDQIGVLAMIYPGYDWSKAFLKKDLA